MKTNIVRAAHRFSSESRCELCGSRQTFVGGVPGAAAGLDDDEAAANRSHNDGGGAVKSYSGSAGSPTASSAVPSSSYDVLQNHVATLQLTISDARTAGHRLNLDIADFELQRRYNGV